MANKRIEELRYVLKMYKNTLGILEVWDIEDLRNRIKDIEKELEDFALVSGDEQWVVEHGIVTQNLQRIVK